MVALKLWGYALGSVVMYWGILLLLLAPLMLGLLLILLTNQIWNQLTNQDTEWKWFVTGWENMVQTIERLNFQWVGWIPGILIQVWYAGYAAHLVQSSSVKASPMGAIAIHALGVSGIIVAAVIFYWLYALVVKVTLPLWVYLLVGGVSFSAYILLLHQPQIAAFLSESWQRVFSALLAGMAESF